MSLSASAWSAALVSAFGAKGFSGPQLAAFCTAIASGSVTYLTGKSFTTADVGSTAGAGVGAGVGISGIVQATVSSTIVGNATGYFGQAGPKLADVGDVVAQVLIAQMATATLSSTHSPVFAGTGTIVPGSINVVGAAWGSAIQSAAPSFSGPMWPSFAKAIGEGCVAGFATATGTVTIAGAGGTPAPGTGTGSGTIS